MAKKMSKKKTRNIIISVVLVVVVISGALFAILKPDDKVEVELAQATKQTIDATLDTTGIVSAASQDEFVLPKGVKVTSLNVKEGDIVKAGDVLATFDTSSLAESLYAKESAYEKAQSAYINAQNQSKTSKTKIADLKKQIADVEAQIAKLESQTTTKPAATTKPAEENVKISDSLVKRFVRIAKLFGVEYGEDEARNVLTKLLSSGNSVSELSSMMDSLSQMAGSSGAFDISSLMGMNSGSMSLEITLLQLKSQLSALEIQSSDTYISAYKTIAEKLKESYVSAQSQLDSMKNGWVATGKGIVSEVNLDEDGNAVASTSTSTDIDISSILSAVTSGGDFSSMLSSFLSDGTAAVKVLYYPLVADISLSKYDVLDINLNQEVKVTSASGKEFAGKVSYVSSVATSSGGINLNSLMGSTASTGSSTVIPAQITIENADSSVMVGVDVDISIVTSTAENVVVVPVEAVCIDGEDIFVYVYDEDEGVAVRKDIELGISDDTYYQVVSGINENDTLIKNTTGLEDGVKVKVK